MSKFDRNPTPPRDHPPEKLTTANGWTRCDQCYRSWKVKADRIPQCTPPRTMIAGWPEK